MSRGAQVTVGSLSKSHAMTGWRAGWVVGPPQLIDHVESLVMCMLFGLPGFIQEAAITALRIAPRVETDVRRYCALRRDWLLAGLGGIEGLRCRPPDAGMFMLVDVRESGLSGYEFMRRLYAAERVSVIDGGAFGSQTGGFIRICFATDEATLREGCLRIRRFATALAVSQGRARPTPISALALPGGEP